MDAVIQVDRIDNNICGSKEESRITLLPDVREDDEVCEVVKEEERELVGGPETKQMINVGEQMQIMCDLYGFKQDTYWDCYRPDQKDALKNKLGLIVSNEFVSEKNLVRRPF